MRRIREVLRLRHQGLTERVIARTLGVSNGVVHGYVRRGRLAGLIWPLPEGLDDESLELLLFPAGESLLSGAQVTEVARKHGATRWQIYDWRQRFRHPLACTRCGLRQRQHVHERGRRAAVRQPKLGGTRSRAYKKNGQAFVQQKNGAIVRRLMGCGRSMASTRRT